MFLGIGSYTWPWAVAAHRENGENACHPQQILERAVAHQIRFVQFCDNMPLHAFPLSCQEELRLMANNHHITIQAGTRGLTQANLERYIRIASFFHSPFIRVVIDDRDYHPSEEDIVRIIRQVLPRLKEKGVMLAIENHDRLPSKILRKIIRATSEEWIGICLDTANSLGAGEGICEVLEILAPYTINVHIKDIRVSRVANQMGFTIEGAPAGQGILDIPAIVERLNHTGRCTTATLELWSNESDSMARTLQNEQWWADTSIQYLKKILS